jgi:hypothetical protein
LLRNQVYADCVDLSAAEYAQIVRWNLPRSAAFVP